MPVIEPHSPLTFAPGALVDHFKLVRLIGRGGMGEVYLARDTKLGRKVALKVIHADAMGSPEATRRFLEEARITARFNHPHIVTIHAVGQIGPQPYVALEYLEGQTLRERMNECSLGLREVVRISLGIAKALEEAHQSGVLHRDLKPENVILPRDGRLRVVDFGLAKAVRQEHNVVVVPNASVAPPHAVEQTLTMPGAEPPPAPASNEPPSAQPTVSADASRASTVLASESPPTAASAVMGTPLYMAPEQWLRGESSQATDMWALGVVVHELLAGVHPFRESSWFETRARVCSGAEPPALPSGTPESIAALVQQCLRSEPDQRPTASDAVTVLRPIAEPGHVALAEDTNPFRGLLPFTESQSDTFFGRDAELAAFLERVRLEPLLFVVGPSGAGKSSFVQAGVIPRLRDQQRWRIITLRPGRSPLEALASRLLHEDSSRSSPREDRTQQRQELQQRLRRIPSSLSILLTSMAERDPSKVLLFVDQLEELFTLVDDRGERAAFLDALCAAADDPDGPVRVIATIRDDFLVRIAESSTARDALRRIVVLRSPGQEELGEILTRSVETAGLRFESQEMVHDIIGTLAGEPACLPLLQLACTRLWEHRDRSAHMLTQTAYESMGGVAGAVAAQADAALEGLTAEQTDLAREIFLRLVTPEGTRRMRPREELEAGLGERAGEVVDRLIQERALLVRKGAGSGEVELAHESMIRTWARLRRWLDDCRDDLAFLAQIQQAADLWQRRGHRHEEVWQGEALIEARRKARRLVSVPPLVTDFLDAGLAVDRRRQRRNRIVVGTVIAVLATVAVALLWMNRVARQEKDHADDQRKLADEQRVQAERERALALREGARAALLRGDLLGARARLRASLESQDASLARSLWWHLSREPLVWRQQVGTSASDVAFAHDGSKVAVAGMDASVYVIDARSSEVDVLRGHKTTDSVYCVAMSARGDIASGTMGGEVRLWNPATKTSRSLEGYPDTVQLLRFDNAGKWLARAGSGGTVRIWDAASGKTVTDLPRHDTTVYTVAFSPSSKVLATAADNIVRLWALPSGDSIAQLRGHEKMITAVAFSPDGNSLASLSTDGTALVWDAARRSLRRRIRTSQTGCWALAYSPGGQRIATGAHDGSIELRDPQTGTLTQTLHAGTAQVNSLSFSPDGRMLASASQDRSVRMWNLDTPDAESERAEPHAHEGGVYTVAFSPDGTTIASSSVDGTLRLWDVTSGRTKRVFRGYSARIFGTSFHPDGRTLASCGSDRVIRLWDVALGRQVAVLSGHQGETYQCTFSPDGTQLASASADETVRLWDLEKLATSKILRGREGEVHDVSFSRDGRWLVSASDDQTARMWDARTGRVARVFQGHASWVWTARFLDADSVVTGSWDQSVRVWSRTTGQGRKLASLDGRVGWLSTGAGHPWLVAPTSEGAVFVWQAKQDAPEKITGHRNTAWSAAISPDRTRFATGSQDGTVRLWDSATLRPVWRTIGVFDSPPSILTHEGPYNLKSTSASPPSFLQAWHEAMPTYPRLAVQTRSGAICSLNWDATASKWTTTTAEAQSVAVPTARDLLSLGDRCIIVHAKQGLSELRADGLHKLYTSEVGAVSTSADALLVVSGTDVLMLDDKGVEKQRWSVEVGVSALAMADERLYLGYADGSVEVLSSTGEELLGHRFEGLPSSRVESLAPGPMGSVIAGYADGTLGVWSLEGGVRLAVRKLHGAVRHLLFSEHRLFAATDLGDHGSIDFGTLQKDYCDLLRDVWDQVPVTWESGRGVLARAPKKHPCASAR